MTALGIAPLAAAFRAGKDDPVQALERALAADERARADHAILWHTPAAADDAEAARQRFRAGDPRGPLDGIPLVVKDCIDVEGTPSTNGTSFLLARAAADAPLVERLRAAGAVVFGKANMHELGILPLGINTHHGTPVNPWAPDRIPGGSSSGSAVAVASGLAAASVGTDSGGSIRVPATLNGLVGLKPTYGAVPSGGIARLTHDLDHAGPIAWTVDDAALIFEVLAGRTLERDAVPGRVAVLADLFIGAEGGIERSVRAAVQRAFGACPDVASPCCRWAAAVEMVVVSTDAHQLCGHLLALHRDELGPDVRAILSLAADISADDRRKADGVRVAMREEVKALLERHDLLVGPAVGRWPPLLHPEARVTGELDPAGMARLAAVTFIANLTGLPSCTVPCVDSGLPMGVQIIGRAGDEARVLAAARAVQACYPPRRPPRWYGA